MERVAGIEPAQPAWKAGVLPLNYTRLNLLRPSAPLKSYGGGGWIRTTEAYASDLQSDPFGHSGTPPKRSSKGRIPWLSHSGAAFYGNWVACAIVSQRFSMSTKHRRPLDKSSYSDVYIFLELEDLSRTWVSSAEQRISSIFDSNSALDIGSQTKLSISRITSYSKTIQH